MSTTQTTTLILAQTTACGRKDFLFFTFYLILVGKRDDLFFALRLILGDVPLLHFEEIASLLLRVETSESLKAEFVLTGCKK